MKEKIKEFLFSFLIGVGLIVISVLMLASLMLLSLYINLSLFPIVYLLILGIVGYYFGREVYRTWKNKNT
jgi:uncharacterized RDD family membrane protein YckC